MNKVHKPSDSGDCAENDVAVEIVSSKWNQRPKPSRLPQVSLSEFLERPNLNLDMHIGFSNISCGFIRTF
jgi:hypothetical protein